MFNSKKALKNDAWLRILPINGVVFIVIAIFVFVEYSDIVYNIIFFILGALMLLLIPLRYLAIKNFPADTGIITGTVLKSSYYRGSKIVKYEFILDGQAYKKSVWLNYNQNTKHLEKEAQIEIMYKSANPKRSTIPDLFYDR